MPRKSSSKEAKDRKELMKYYEEGKSAYYAAKQLGINRHTAEKHYRKLREAEEKENIEDFLNRQKHAKEVYLGKLDDIIDRAEGQYEEIIEKLVSDHGDGEDANLENLRQRQLKFIADLWDAKTVTESTKTFNVASLEWLEEQYAKISEFHSEAK